MIIEYYAPSPPKEESILQCEDCGEVRRSRRNKELLKREEHPCRSCSNKRNGVKKRGRPSWNSGKKYSIAPVEKTSYINTSGYREIWCGRGEGSRGRKDGYKLEHHMVIEDHIGRSIKKGEVVHHIDGDKLNNNIENLYLFESVSKHRQSHNSLEDIAMQMVKDGLIGFKDGKYYRI